MGETVRARYRGDNPVEPPKLVELEEDREVGLPSLTSGSRHMRKSRGVLPAAG